MKKFPCPSCGADVRFASEASVYAVCPYCKSMLVRMDQDLRLLGQMAALQDDVSPLQVDASGTYGGKSFRLIGRLRQSWERGYWDEWCALFSTGKIGWLAEAQGFYYMSFEAEADALPRQDILQPGQEVAFGGQTWKVDDLKKARCSYSEGELPFSAPVGRQALSVDLSSDDQGFATLDYGPEGTTFYEGRSVDFDELKLGGLRSIDGW